MKHFTRRRVITWIVLACVVLVGAWFLSTLLQVVGKQKQDQLDRDQLQEQVINLAASRDELQGAIQDLNQRCRNAKNCVPIDLDDLRGVPGLTGATGASGPPGRNGLDGQNGSDGAKGDPGQDGKDGSPGPAGPPGSTGPPGPKGDKGDTGDAGSNGADGTPAVPFTFRFTIPGNGNSGDTTYVCTVDSPNSTVTCQVA